MVWRKFHRTWPIPVAHQHGCQKRHSSWQRSSSPSKWVSFSAPCVTGCLDGSCGTALREGSAWGMWKNAVEAVGVDLALWWTWHNRQRWHIVGRLTLSVLAVAVMWTLKWAVLLRAWSWFGKMCLWWILTAAMSSIYCRIQTKSVQTLCLEIPHGRF